MERKAKEVPTEKIVLEIGLEKGKEVLKRSIQDMIWKAILLEAIPLALIEVQVQADQA